jgi:hypothetical protein
MSKKRLEDLVAEDMKMVGKETENWVKGDMETLGRTEHAQGGPVAKESHQKRESDAFMATRPLKLARETEEAGTDSENLEGSMNLLAESEEKVARKNSIRRFLAHETKEVRSDADNAEGSMAEPEENVVKKNFVRRFLHL